MNVSMRLLLILVIAILATIGAYPVQKLGETPPSTIEPEIETFTDKVLQSIFITPCRSGYMFNHKGECKKVNLT